MSDFSLSVRAADGVVAVAVAGDVDLAEADGLWQELSPLLAPASTMLLDCSAVDFLDSSGLRTLVRLADWADVVGARFQLAAVSHPVRRVVELAGVGHVFAGPEEDASVV